MLLNSYAALVALFLSVSLYGPVVIALDAVRFNYAVFAGVALVLVANARTMTRGGVPTVLLYFFIAFMLVATIASNSEIRVDLIGLLMFLPASYFLGLWARENNRAPAVMGVMLLLFLPVAVYVVYQLSLNGFSYNTYMRWSNAQFKIGYLDFSLYAVVLFLYFSMRAGNLFFRVVPAAFLLTCVLISGARYSILFILLFSIFAIAIKLRRRAIRFISITTASVVIITSLIALGALRPELILKLFEYSIFRLTSALGHDQSIAARFDLIERALSSSMSELFLGYGIGGSTNVLRGTYPHNFVLEALLDGGIFSASILVGFVFACFLVSIRRIPKDHIWVVALALFVLGAFLKSFSLYHARVLFFSLGYLVGYRALAYSSIKRSVKNAMPLNKPD